MEHRKVTFERENLPAGARVQDARFVQCSFVNCGNDPGEWSFVERCSFERTLLKSKGVRAMVVREVTLDTCKNTAIFVLTNCLFDRVKLTGSFGSLMVSWAPEHLAAAQRAYAANFYDEVEWALDIREAKLKQLTLRGVPGAKVLRDPARHFLVRKDRLLADRSWEGFEVGVKAILRASAARSDEDEILVAGDLSDKLRAQVAEYEMLREAGFVE